MTYPGHTMIATGATVARHGVTANNVFEPPSIEGRGFWFASDVKVPTLADVAHAAGLTVGSVSWPSTAGSKSIDWNVPEFWTTAAGKEFDLMRKYATSGLLSNIEASPVGAMTKELREDGGKWDAFLAACAIHIVREHKPNLLYVHLIETDKMQHKHGRNAPMLPEVLRRVDGDVRDIIEATKKAGIYERTTFIVVGDHGFSSVSNSLAANIVLAQNGFIKLESDRVVDWKAMVQNTGGSAVLYLRDPNDKETAASVLAVLEKAAVDEHGTRLYRIISKDQLVNAGGPSGAAFYLEAEPGNMFSPSLKGDSLVRASTLKGNHGFPPTRPEMRTGFIAAGYGIKKGVVLDEIRLTDVAPTAAVLLHVKLDNADGRALQEILASPQP